MYNRMLALLGNSCARRDWQVSTEMWSEVVEMRRRLDVVWAALEAELGKAVVATAGADSGSEARTISKICRGIATADYVHAKCFLTTRAISAPAGKAAAGDIALCCPVLDLPNQTASANARFVPFVEHGAVQIQTTVAIKPGEQIFLLHYLAAS